MAIAVDIRGHHEVGAERLVGWSGFESRTVGEVRAVGMLDLAAVLADERRLDDQQEHLQVEQVKIGVGENQHYRLVRGQEDTSPCRPLSKTASGERVDGATVDRPSVSIGCAEWGRMETEAVLSTPGARHGIGVKSSLDERVTEIARLRATRRHLPPG